MSDDLTVPRDVHARGNQRDGVPRRRRRSGRAPSRPALATSSSGPRASTSTTAGFKALEGVTLDILRNEILALIGPSGCGKTTFLRCLNRMNDLIPGTRVDGTLLFDGQDLYASDVDPWTMRRRIGMVFQKPNPFPKSVKDNIAFGLKVNGLKANDDRIEEVLRRAALWDEVKDKLKQDAFELSGGQQQRLCIARAIATEVGRVVSWTSRARRSAASRWRSRTSCRTSSSGTRS